MTHEVKTNHIDDIKGLIEDRNEERIKDYLSSLHFSDIARVLEAIEEDDMVYAFRLLTPDVASEVFLEVDERLRDGLISVISSTELVEVVDEMETDDAADVISDLPQADARKVLDGIEEEDSIEVQKLMRYAEDTAGGKMQAELIAIHEDATVDETIEEVRSKSADVENITNIFVVNSSNELTGVVSLDKLILAEWGDAIKKLVDKEPVKVATDLDQEEVARIFQRYDLLSMPVVDSSNRLVGRITIDDVVDVLEEEIFEDFYRMASLNIGERALDTPFRSFKMRAPWLLLNLVTAFFAVMVVRAFQDTIETLVILAVLMPVVAGLGGNAATQTITVVIRGLALGEFHTMHTRRMLMKEAMVGLANGLLIGAVAGFAAFLFGAGPMIGVLLFLAMTANLIIAAVGGAGIPLILKWFKVDPALSASIFVTACTDT
ncbi:MAG: magnesium transporter, partial [Thermodesulfobacteriota bacterium]